MQINYRLQCCHDVVVAMAGNADNLVDAARIEGSVGGQHDLESERVDHHREQQPAVREVRVRNDFEPAKHVKSEIGFLQI